MTPKQDGNLVEEIEILEDAIVVIRENNKLLERKISDNLAIVVRIQQRILKLKAENV